MPFTTEELQRAGDKEAYRRAFQQKFATEPTLSFNDNIVFPEGNSPRDENLDGPVPPFHYCALKGLLTPLTALLEWNDAQHSLDINQLDQFNRTALHYACREGKLSVVSELIKKRAVFNQNPDLHPFSLLSAENKINLLHTACENGWIEVVQELLELGVDCQQAKAGDDWTPLHRAANSGHEVIVETLLRQGARIESTTQDGSTPLHMAAASIHPEVVSCLIRNGANVLALKRGSENTPLMQLLQGEYDSSKRDEYKRIVTDFLECPPYKITDNESEISQRITRSRSRDTYITAAVRQRFDESIIELLLSRIPPASTIINYLTAKGTALHIAIANSFTGIIPILLKQGADLSITYKVLPTDLGETPFYKIIERNASNTRMDLVENYLSLYVSKLPEDKKKNAIVELIVQIQTDKKRTVLHLAAAIESHDVLTFLLNQFDLTDPTHRTFLRSALDAKDHGDNTPQKVAANSKRSENFRILNEWNKKLMEASAPPAAVMDHSYVPVRGGINGYSASRDTLPVALPEPSTQSGASAPSSARVSSTRTSFEDLQKQASAILYPYLKEEESYDIFDHIRDHPYHYLLGALTVLLLIATGFFAACAFSSALAAAIPIVSFVENTLVAANIVSASAVALPIVAKVITTLIPLLTTLTFGLMIGIGYGLYKVGDWLFNDILLADDVDILGKPFINLGSGKEGYHLVPTAPPTPKPGEGAAPSTHAAVSTQLSSQPPGSGSVSTVASASQGGGEFTRVLQPVSDHRNGSSGASTGGHAVELQDFSSSPTGAPM